MLNDQKKCEIFHKKSGNFFPVIGLVKSEKKKRAVLPNGSFLIYNY